MKYSFILLLLLGACTTPKKATQLKIVSWHYGAEFWYNSTQHVSPKDSEDVQRFIGEFMGKSTF